MNKAIFFDRDDTLIVNKHYLSDPDQVEYMPSTFKLLSKLQLEGYLLFIVTNQSGIGRGMFLEKDMHLVHQKILHDFEKEGIKIHDIAFCPHHPDDGCECRKPGAKMLNDLCSKYDIDKSQSIMVGDKEIDVQAGLNAGMKGFLIEDFIKINFQNTAKS